MQSSSTECRVSECNLETSVTLRPRHIGAVEPLKMKYLFTLTSYMFQHSCGHLQAVHLYEMLICTANIVLLFSFSVLCVGKAKRNFLKV